MGSARLREGRLFFPSRPEAHPLWLPLLHWSCLDVRKRDKRTSQQQQSTSGEAGLATGGTGQDTDPSARGRVWIGPAERGD